MIIVYSHEKQDFDIFPIKSIISYYLGPKLGGNKKPIPPYNLNYLV